MPMVGQKYGVANIIRLVGSEGIIRCVEGTQQGDALPSTQRMMPSEPTRRMMVASPYYCSTMGMRPSKPYLMRTRNKKRLALRGPRREWQGNAEGAKTKPKPEREREREREREILHHLFMHSVPAPALSAARWAGTTHRDLEAPLGQKPRSESSTPRRG